ncbi:holo-ACP synthase [Methylovorus sp. MM2]|uniref:holo-ACP synthase n=1 Tax=Methylovorus sp. MM2 TaxID=1848038 RepID=UPI0007DF0835|nr:holo-ACP synthase [Methylovorus sp. MM2]OAM52585.1 holo-ACP synthase [Methylovorus sp. MM2]
MIYGIGTDIVEVSRIEDSLARFGDAFAQRILNEQEWLEYGQSNTKARFLAKRFAAKEAFAKALGTGIRSPATFENIGVGHDDLGKPVLDLAAELQAFIDKKGISFQHISISDEKALAAAFVVLEKVG